MERDRRWFTSDGNHYLGKWRLDIPREGDIGRPVHAIRESTFIPHSGVVRRASGLPSATRAQHAKLLPLETLPDQASEANFIIGWPVTGFTPFRTMQTKA